MNTPGKYMLLISLLLTCLLASAQIKDIGLPFIVNHQRNVYNASTQNWSITQSKKGFMYFANNDGILEYDGTSWKLYPVPNGSVVRSVRAMGDTIFAGAFEQMGYLAPDTSGKLVWHSLHHLVPYEYSGFDEIWKIYFDNGKVIFQSFSSIFIYDGHKMEVIRSAEGFGFMHKIGENQVFIADYGQGLMMLTPDNELVLINDHPVFFESEITAMVPHKAGGIIIGTAGEGLYLLENQSLQPWNCEVNAHLKQHNLFSAALLAGGNLAFGSVRNGLFITDQDGRILQHLNRSKGLQNNTVLALFHDRKNNLWLGLDNGIDYIEISSPLSVLNYNFNIESAYSGLLHNQILYLGTNQGLFAAHVHDLRNTGGENPLFTLIQGTEGQVWNLEVIDNTLFCGHNYGSFQIDGFRARQISDIRGFWSFKKIPGLTDTILAGTYTGLVRLVKRGNNWHFLDEVEGFRESSRELFIDHTGLLWIAHGYRGLFKLEMNDDFSRVLNRQLLRAGNGLPQELPYNIQDINGEMVVTTREGFKTFDYREGSFVPESSLDDLFADKPFIEKIYQDSTGNLWYFTENYMGVMRLLEDGSFRDIVAPFSRINNFLIPAFHNIFTVDARNIFIGTQIGMVHYDPFIINDYSTVERVFLKEVSAYSTTDTWPFFLHSQQIADNDTIQPVIPFSFNSISFRYTSPVYEDPTALRFSYQLLGFDETWSQWDAVNFKEYTNLREGNYTFQVKARNAFGVESPVTSFSFTIEPPFFRSRTAYTIYAILLLLIIAGNFFFVRRRILKIRHREKIRHEKRLAQREKLFEEQSALSEKEIIQLRNESLENEMRHKNKELANATLHLIQKNKALTAVKNDLNKVLRSLPPDHPEKHSVNSLLKKVNKDLRNEKNWELFNNYFDDVHQDFISRLKDKHEDLTPKELRLCAYLRMNLTTKEIAPLMNISIRGVEISRYRLRKKLQIHHDTNLSDYLISF